MRASGTTVTSGHREPIAATVPSVEPLSSTIAGRG
jgi:hypothetical protein